MNIVELLKYIEVLKNSNSVGNDLLVKLYQKFSQPLACLIVALAGAPLGLLARRSRSSIGLVYSAVIVFIYYVLQSSGSRKTEPHSRCVVAEHRDRNAGNDNSVLQSSLDKRFAAASLFVVWAPQ